MVRRIGGTAIAGPVNRQVRGPFTAGCRRQLFDDKAGGIDRRSVDAESKRQDDDG